MKILFTNRKNCFSQRGGDTVQMEKTKEYIEKLYPDTEIKIAHTPEEIINDAESEIVHIYNMTNTDEVIGYIKAAKQVGKKVVISPIYYNSIDSIYVSYLKFFGIYGLNLPIICKKTIILFFNFFIIFLGFFFEKYNKYVKNGLYLFPQNKKKGKYILKNSDIILPNSDTERDRIEQYYKCNIVNKTEVIPNATEFHLNKPLDKKTLDIYLPDKFILEIGRNEIIKNQLNLIKALKNNSEIPIVLVGKIFKDKYGDCIKKHGKERGNVFIYDEIPHDKVLEVYKKAMVHVLPSYMETTGLVTMEAKAMGAEIVTSNEKYCPIKYYKFDELGFQCDPYDVESIKNAVLEAYYHPKKTELTEEYKQFFSYENVAKMTYKAYLKVLGK